MESFATNLLYIMFAITMVYLSLLMIAMIGGMIFMIKEFIKDEKYEKDKLERENKEEELSYYRTILNLLSRYQQNS